MASGGRPPPQSSRGSPRDPTRGEGPKGLPLYSCGLELRTYGPPENAAEGTCSQHMLGISGAWRGVRRSLPGLEGKSLGSSGGPKGLGAIVSRCSQERSAGQELSGDLGSKHSALRPPAGGSRPPRAWMDLARRCDLPPQEEHREGPQEGALPLPLQPRLKEAQELGLPDVSCWEPVTIATPCLGTKLPAGRRDTGTSCQRGAAEPETPQPLPLDSQPSLCPRQKQARAFLLFRDSVLGTYTLLGLLFLPTLSLPVSMATPPNSRFQAAMTSPFPFLPPRPGGAAALGSCSGLPVPQARPQGLWATAGLSSLLALRSGPSAGSVLLSPAPESGCAAAQS